MTKYKKPAPKPHTRHQPPAGQRAAAPGRTATAPVFDTTGSAGWLMNIRLQSLFIGALAFLLYANTLGHGFTLDDSIVINENMFTKQGVKGIPGLLTKDTFFGFFKVEGKAELVSGGRYRPLTPVLFALTYQIAGEKPFAYHLLTVLLFALTCVVLYRTLRRLLLPRFGAEYATLVAGIAALLFTAHPIHTEVVANIKGCDEIVTLLLSLSALWLVLKAYDTGRASLTLWAGLAFFLACLSKENASTFVVVIPLALWFFRDRSNGENKGILPWVWTIWAAFLLFFLIRAGVLGWFSNAPKGVEIVQKFYPYWDIAGIKFGKAPQELMNNPFLKFVDGKWIPFSTGEHLATIVYTLGKYIQLLFFPHPLTHDYYPRHIGRMTFGDAGVLISLLVYVGLVVYLIRGWRRRDPVRFGVLFFLLTLSIVSNLVFPIGTNMGERFAFMPSVGFCLALAALLVSWLGVRSWKTPVMLAGAIALLFAVKTVVRNTAWTSNENLFLTDVTASGNSAKIRNACGGVLVDKARLEQDEAKRQALARRAVAHLDKAVEIHPTYKDAYMSRGAANFYMKQYDASVADYRRAWQLAEGDERIKTSLSQVLRETGKYYGEQKGDLDGALRHLNESWQMNNRDPETARLLGVAFGNKGNAADAVMWFGKAVELAPENASYLYDLGTAKAIAGDPAGGEALRKRALEIDPKLLETRRKK